MVKQRKRIIVVIICLAAVLIGLCAFTMLLQTRSDSQDTVSTAVGTTLATTTIETTLEQTTATTECVPVPTESPIPLNRFDEDDFAYDGDYLACLSEWYLRGIDVSKYQGKIDWQLVKDAGFSFVMIRVGGRGYGQKGVMFPDEYADANYQGAKAVGLKVGAYFFSQATSVDEAIEEAQYALELTKDWELDLPIVYDWEYLGDYARTANVEDRVLTDCAIAFCEEIKTAGRNPMIYVSPWFGKYILEDLTEYPQWLALYTGHMTYRYKFDMWQYTCLGDVPGVKGNVDVNLLFLGSWGS